MLKYAGALASSDSCCSAHSVEPIRPSSSPSQLAKIMVRFGFQPDFSSSPTPCTAFEHRRRAAVRIDRAVDPGVAMIARNHPFVGKLAAAHAANHIPESAELIVLLEMHLHPHRSRSHVIGERQRTLPFARRVVARPDAEEWARHRDRKAA